MLIWIERSMGTARRTLFGKEEYGEGIEMKPRNGKKKKGERKRNEWGEKGYQK